MQYGSNEKREYPLSVVPQSPGYIGDHSIGNQSPIIPILSEKDKVRLFSICLKHLHTNMV